MGRSVDVHNIKRDILCDWIEASIVFQVRQISRSDVVDALVDNEVYEHQDLAHEIVEEAWNVLRARAEYLKNPLGIKVEIDRITRDEEWTQFPAYGFCLALACAEVYPNWARTWSSTASTYGDYFEDLAAASFSANFSGWTVKKVGWSPTNKLKLKATIHGLIEDLNEREGADLDLHVTDSANELGLDLLAYHSYGDVHSSFPVMLIQCASGKNWSKKRHTPDINLWKSIVAFNSHPIRGMAMPFAFAEQDEFRRMTKSVDGIFVDRNRLLGAFPRKAGSVPAALNKKLMNWTKKQLANIPTDRD